MPYSDSTRCLPRATLLAVALVSASAVAASELAAQAATLSPDPQHGMVLYLKHCAGCHGRQAWGDGPRVIPALAGQRESYLVIQLAHFSDGSRTGSELHGPVMHDVLEAPDIKRAQALRDLGAWLARAAPDGAPDQGAGQGLAAAKRSYANGCAGCHGSDGAGSEVPAVPAVAAQHYSYLLGQLREFAAGRRAHAPGLGPALFGTAEQQQAMADYLSRLPLPRPTGGS